MGTNEECMAWVNDEIGRSVGLPREVGGIPLDDLGATGWGLCQAVEIALPFCNFPLTDARLVVQGFGAVGKHAARFLAERGVTLVGASDSRGTLHDPGGIRVDELIRIKNQGGSVLDYSGGTKSDRDAVIDLECEIWVPAARPDVLHEDNVHRLKAKLVAQGANIPLTLGAEQYLHEQGVLCLPDFIVNAGGVICAAMEYHGSTQTEVFRVIAEKIRDNTQQVLMEASQGGLLPRQAAINLATRRVERAMSCKRWRIF
jgi:glutamate dehydrogenase (NAD(P)+)